ncbi:hypothetical protein CYMTET_24875 [Cymbomonas tetramitiformis]|uniref:Uncharacterized protein n=1 Tax=Cymbomonas tetramitiformis TaxID=36881 RepID=A0AAE0KZM3_9CHLO|nr:hypothetical protein CYMTET_40843 [Cymbomonas tetramitiformis]KAK3266507.1 hypothetical protein CYMTET_24875 [Cymbomonas tetramitiformis]
MSEPLGNGMRMRRHGAGMRGALEALTQGSGVLGSRDEGASGSASVISQAAPAPTLSVDALLVEVNELLLPSLDWEVCTQERGCDWGKIAEVSEALAAQGLAGVAARTREQRVGLAVAVASEHMQAVVGVVGGDATGRRGNATSWEGRGET